MVRLSQYFVLEEFQHNDEIPAECVPAFVTLCQEILDPVRVYFADPLKITSGYRSPAANAAAHGIPNSEHMATKDWCAADFYVDTNRFPFDMRAVFDWMRNNARLPFHQLILEHGAASSVIHVSWNRLKPGLRSIKEGSTHNATPYIDWPGAAYEGG